MNLPSFISRSQAGQDRWVEAILVTAMGIRDGSFLDIGACHPVELSNTYGLEQIGWRGLLVDNDPGAVALCQQHRQSRVVQGDATALDWQELLHRDFGHLIDYLSLDVDGATEDTLRGLLASGIRFRCATVEHDRYRFGQDKADRIRAQLLAAGYELICKDVTSEGHPFEDWWVAPNLVDTAAARAFACEGKEGLTIAATR